MYNFHSYGFRAYTAWVRCVLGDEHVDRASSSAADVVETQTKGLVCHSAIRLLVGFHLRDHPLRRMLTVLFRPFVAALADLARTHGYMLPDGVLAYDEDALAALVAKFRLDNKLESTWRSAVSQPEKLAIERCIGAGPDRRIEVGIEITTHVLDLSLQFATKEVEGVQMLVNDSSQETFRAPFVDRQGMNHIPAVKALAPVRYPRVICDEGQDLDRVQIKLVTDALAPGGSLMWVGDRSQTVYLYRGVQIDVQDELLERALTVTLNKNYRSAKKINECAQEVLDRMGRDILIETVRDVEGKVVNAPLYAEPINLRNSTLFVGRCTRHLLVFYKVLIALRYPAVVHGQPDTVRELQSCLAEIEGRAPRGRAPAAPQAAQRAERLWRRQRDVRDAVRSQ